MLHSYIKSCQTQRNGVPLVKHTRRNGTCFEGLWLPWNVSERVLIWYDILLTVKPKLRLAKAVQPLPILGLYSGIFGMYLQHSGSQQSTYKAKNILFYALWVLYALSAATVIFDILTFCWVYAVSMDDHRCLTLFQLFLQNIETQYYDLDIIENTVFACCDFITQIILVRTTGNAYYFSNFLKDISLLDCVELQHSCCDRSLTLGIRILRSIELFSRTD